MIKGNRANDNGSWGIYAGVPSNGRTNVDAGGNRGQGNLGPLDPITLQPQQCHLVDCVGGPPISSDTVPPETQLIERPPNPSTQDVAVFRFTGHRQRQRRHVPVLGHRHARLGGVRALRVAGRVRGPDASACTTSRCARSTPPATSTARRRPTAGPSARSPPAGRPRRRSSPGRTLTTVRTDAAFSFLADERNATFECRVDAAAFAPCAWTGVPGLLTGTRGSVSYTGLSVGTHTFQVRATDTEGNTDATPAAWTWRVTDPPVADARRLRPVRHAQHQAHQRPDRLPRPRPDRRRERHHDRPRRPRHRRQRASTPA